MKHGESYEKWVLKIYEPPHDSTSGPVNGAKSLREYIDYKIMDNRMYIIQATTEQKMM